MYKVIFFLFISVNSLTLFAKCSEVPEAIRKSYASDFYQAFALQCDGKSTAAFCQFQVACEAAKKSGESLLRLMILEQLFGWYRMYGSSLKLFSKDPTGNDRIIGEYKRPSKRLGYNSEWGNNPQQAAIIREFMLGVGETISGVFCVSIGVGVVTGIGIGLLYDGPRRIFVTLNNLWAEHEAAMIALKKWEQVTQKVAQSD